MRCAVKPKPRLVHLCLAVPSVRLSEREHALLGFPPHDCSHTHHIALLPDRGVDHELGYDQTESTGRRVTGENRSTRKQRLHDAIQFAPLDAAGEFRYHSWNPLTFWHTSGIVRMRSRRVVVGPSQGSSGNRATWSGSGSQLLELLSRKRRGQVRSPTRPAQAEKGGEHEDWRISAGTRKARRGRFLVASPCYAYLIGTFLEAR